MRAPPIKAQLAGAVTDSGVPFPWDDDEIMALQVPDGVVAIIHEVKLSIGKISAASQFDDWGKRYPITLHRSSSAPSAGSATQELYMETPGVPKCVMTVRSTTRATEGDVFLRTYWNPAEQFHYWPTPEMRPVIDMQGTQYFLVSLGPTDGQTVQLQGKIVWREYGS